MLHLAIFSDHQHEQYGCCFQRLGLRNSRSHCEHVVPVFEDDPQLEDCPLVIKLEQNFVHVETAATTKLRSQDGRKLTSNTLLRMPCRLSFGDTWLEFRTAEHGRPLVPLKQTGLEDLISPSSSNESHSGPSAATVTRWLTATAKLHRAAAGSPEFYQDAARFAVETVWARWCVGVAT